MPKAKPAKKKSSRPFNPEWSTTVTHAISVKRKNLILAIGLTGSGSEWTVVASETPSAPLERAKGATAKVESFLAEHSHKVLGTFGMTEAVRIATEYAQKWLGGESTDELCGCGEIMDGPMFDDGVDYDAIAHKVLGEMTPTERDQFARSELPKTSKKPRGRVGSALNALKGVRDVRQSKATSHP